MTSIAIKATNTHTHTHINANENENNKNLFTQFHFISMKFFVINDDVFFPSFTKQLNSIHNFINKRDKKNKIYQSSLNELNIYTQSVKQSRLTKIADIRLMSIVLHSFGACFHFGRYKIWLRKREIILLNFDFSHSSLTNTGKKRYGKIFGNFD